MTVAGGGPPPEDTAAGWGGSWARVRNDPHDRAQGEHAPCKPERGDRRGCNRSKGRVTTGATRQPPPQRRDKCRASCLHRASDVLAQKGGQRERPPPPPPPTPTPTHKKGEDGEETARGHGGGQRKKKKKNTKRTTKDTNTPEQGQIAGADGTWREPGGTARGAGQGDAPGDESWEAGTNGGGPGWQEPANNAGEVPDLWGLGAPLVSVSAPSEREQ